MAGHTIVAAVTVTEKAWHVDIDTEFPTGRLTFARFDPDPIKTPTIAVHPRKHGR